MSLGQNFPWPSGGNDLRRCLLGGRSYWLCQALGWGGLFLLMSGPLPLNARASSSEVFALLFYSSTGLILSHLLRLLLLSVLGPVSTWSGLLLRLVPAVLTVTGAHVAIQIAWAKGVCPHDAVLMTTRPGRDPVLLTFADTFSLSAGVFIAWTGFYFGIRLYRQYQAARIERLELAAQVQAAALQALRAQLNPHLLFNSLNSIRSLIPQEMAAPRVALTHLAELLRSSLSLKQDELISLRRELETVESYLALEKLRFEERLTVSRAVEEKALDWLVPPFLVQLLAENAVKYGIAPLEEGGCVFIAISIQADSLVVEVTSPGRLGASASAHSTGQGLANIRSRLSLLFGSSATLTLDNLGTCQVLARAVVPAARTGLAHPQENLK